MKDRHAVLALTLAVFVVLVPHAASAVSLVDLVENGETITAGDKLFSDFVVLAADPPSLSGIDVLPAVTALGEGLQLTTDHAISQLFLSFSVAVLDPAFLISDIAVAIAGDAVALAFATIAVGDQVLAGVSAVVPDSPIGVEDLTSAVASAQISFFVLSESETEVSVFVSQTPVAPQVPEPSVLLLLTAGAGSLAFAVRRYR